MTESEPRQATVFKVFQFTDLVGSADLKRRLGDQAGAAAISAHDALFRECLSQHDGREENETGDGFLASFDRPSQAVLCALAFQAELNSLDAPEQLHVRMGIHAGEIIEIEVGCIVLQCP